MKSVFFKGVLILGFCASLLGCANSDSGNDDGKAQNSKTVLINGKTPEEYYKQFVFNTTGDCGEKNIYIHFLESENVAIDSAPDGKDMKVNFVIRLHADHKFSAHYEELKINYYIPNGFASNTVFENDTEGTWKIGSEGEIMLEGLGVGQAFEYNESPAIQFTFDRDLHSAGLKGKNSFLRMMMTSADEKDERAHCSKNLTQ